MLEKYFRNLKEEELNSGVAVWLHGKGFEDTSITPHPEGTGPVCGPYLIERVIYRNNVEPRVFIINPETGRGRSMMSSWLLVPREKQC